MIQCEYVENIYTNENSICKKEFISKRDYITKYKYDLVQVFFEDDCFLSYPMSSETFISPMQILCNLRIHLIQYEKFHMKYTEWAK